MTFDRGSGVSHYTGQITHHIAPDLDAERNRLLADLTAAGMVTTLYQVSGIGPTLNGRNGGGDLYYTDGEIRMAVLAVGGQPRTEPPRRTRAHLSLPSRTQSGSGPQAPSARDADRDHAHSGGRRRGHAS